MTTQSSVAALKQRFEHLFPGKWVNADARQKTLLTGLSEIDHGFSRGLVRKRITEWIGPPSSGKTSILRTIIGYWCVSGLDVAYVDAENRLVAADWAFIQQNKCGAYPEYVSGLIEKTPYSKAPGKFWVIRNLVENEPTAKRGVARSNAECSVSTRGGGEGTAVDGALKLKSATPDIHIFAKHRWQGKSLEQNHLWAADELIRTNAFDVVVLDLGSSECTKPIGSRVYARLQNSLEKSQTAMIIVRDTESHDNCPSPGWGCCVQVSFHWGENIKCMDGLNGKAMIVPSINCALVKDGLSQSKEVSVVSNVTNRLFTHPSVPDRRTPKTRAVQKS